MKLEKIKYNAFTSLLYQVVAILCGFIIPRLIIGIYGSDINGLISSINEFLAIITFMEMGVGTVVQSSLYKPLANNDRKKISAIIVEATGFFKKIAFVFLLYIAFLMFAYPHFVNKKYGMLFTDVLIMAIAINFFVQYYFGIVDRLLLMADQRGYIYYLVNAITLVMNTIGSVILILMGMQIHYVKLLTSIVYIIRPIVIRIYVNKHYIINRKIKFFNNSIKQKWNGFTQHLASFVLDGTDTIVLSLFSTLENVSIYAVYYLIIKGVRELFLSTASGFQSFLGALWARKQFDDLNKFFEKMEWFVHNSTIFIFGCTASLIVPFIKLYTEGIEDANYVQPMFAIVLTMANAFRCIRLPYNQMIFAAGHFKESQNNFVIAVVINITISIITVINYGLIGVAVGTLVAMIYQTIWMANYSMRQLLNKHFVTFWKHLLVDAIIVMVALLLCVVFDLNGLCLDYFQWIINALKICIIWFLTIIAINFMFYKKEIFSVSRFAVRKILKIR